MIKKWTIISQKNMMNWVLSMINIKSSKKLNKYIKFIKLKKK